MPRARNTGRKMWENKKKDKRLLKDLTEEELNFEIKHAFNRATSDLTTKFMKESINEMNNPTAEQLIDSLKNKNLKGGKKKKWK